MTTPHQIKEDLEFVASTVRRQDRPSGVPEIYYLWAPIVAVGFFLPDFKPNWSGAYWLIAGIGGGLLSWFLGERASKRWGVYDAELGRRIGWHWTIGGVGFVLAALPMVMQRVDPTIGAANYLLLAGLAYAFAGVHFDWRLLWSGVIMFIGYAILIVFPMPYVWTATGGVIALSLIWAGLSSRTRAASN
jgi:hypothetical protein